MATESQKAMFELVFNVDKKPLDDADDSAKKLTKSTDDLSKKAKEATGIFDNMKGPLTGVTQTTRGLEQAFASISSGSMSTAMTGMGSLVGGVNKATESVSLAAVGVGVLAAALDYALLKVLGEVVSVLKDATKVGIEYADNLTKITVGMAGLITNNQLWTDSQGKSVDGTRAFNAALAVSTDMMVQFRTAANKYGLDINDLGKAFDLNTAKMSAFGIQLKDQVTLINNLAVAGKAAGLDASMLPQQTMMLLSGNVGARNKLAAVLGFTSEDIKNAERLGNLVDEVAKKMPSITEAVELQNSTWSAGLALVKTNLDSILGDSFAPLADSLGVFARELLDFINKPEVKDTFKHLGSDFKDDFELAKPALKDLLTLALSFAVQIERVVAGMAYVGNLVHKLKPPTAEELAAKGLDPNVPYVAPNKYKVDLPLDITAPNAWGVVPGIDEGAGDVTNTNKPQGDTAAGAKLIATLQRQNDLLTSQDPLWKAIAKAQDDYAAEVEKIEVVVESAAQKSTALGLAKKNELAAISKARTEAANKATEEAMKAANLSQNLMDKEYAESLTGVAKKIALIDYETNKQVAADAAAGASSDALLARQQEGEDKKHALTEANAEWTADTLTKLTDQLTSVSTNYYAKEEANINKEYDNEKASYDKRLKNGDLDPQQYDNVLAAAKAYHDAKMAQAVQEQNSVIGLRKTYQDLADDYVKTTNDIAGGVKAGWLEVAASLKSTTEDMRDYVIGIFGAMTTGVNSVFFDLLTTKVTSFSSLFKNMISDLQKSFAKFMTDTIMPYVKKAMDYVASIGATGSGNTKPGVQGPPAPGDSSGGTISASGAGWVGAGLAAASMVSSASGSNTFMAGEAPYLSLAGAIAGSQGFANIAADIVAAVVLVVGSIINALTPATKDYTSSYTGGNMLRAIKTGMAFGSEGTDTQVSTSYALTISNGMIDMFSSIFNRVDAVHGNELLTALDSEMLKYFASIGTVFGAHAGGKSDFQADILKIFTDIIPKEIMHAFFGQTTISMAPQGGITGVVTQPNTGGTYGGTNQFSKVDANSPLVQFLNNLGFSIDKINQIAGQIDVMAPADFQKYFSGIVNAVLDFQNNIKNLSQNYAQIVATIQGIEKPDVVGNLKLAAGTIINLGAELTQYTGQDQIDHANTLNAASAQYYQDALKALQALQDMINQIMAQAQSFDDAAAGFMKDANWKYQDFKRYSDPNSGYNAFTQADQNKNDPNALQGIWNTFIAQATASLNYLTGIWNQFNTELSSIQDLTKSFGELDKSIGRNTLDINTIAEDFHTYEGLLGKLHDYLQNTDPSSTTYFSGLEAITSQVGVSLSSLYSEIQTFLQSVYSAQQGLNSSAASNIWSNNYAIAGNTKNPVEGANAQEDMIRAAIQQDMSDIKSATDPSVVTAKSQDIYRLLGMYEGFFKPGDPNYNAAYTWANGVITQLQTTGTYALTGMGVSASAIVKDLGPGGVDAVSATNLLTIAMGTVQTAIIALQASVDALSLKIGTSLTDTSNTIIGDMNRVSIALQAAMLLFTQALAPPVDPNPDPTGDPNKKKTPPQQDATTSITELGTSAFDANNQFVTLIGNVKLLNNEISQGSGGA